MKKWFHGLLEWCIIIICFISILAKLPAKFLRPEQVIELEKDNSRLKEENIQLRKRESYLLIKVPIVVFFVTLSMYFVIRKFR